MEIVVLSQSLTSEMFLQRMAIVEVVSFALSLLRVLISQTLTGVSTFAPTIVYFRNTFFDS